MLIELLIILSYKLSFKDLSFLFHSSYLPGINFKWCNWFELVKVIKVFCCTQIIVSSTGTWLEIFRIDIKFCNSKICIVDKTYYLLLTQSMSYLFIVFKWTMITIRNVISQTKSYHFYLSIRIWKWE